MKNVFIGSSKEAIGIARHLQALLESMGVETTCWPENFRVSGYTLDEIIDASKKHSAGIFVLNADDCLTTRDENKDRYVARDNVLVEAGVFCGTLGKDCVALCCLPGVHVPTDFAGLTHLIYEPMQIENFKQKLKEWIDDKVDDTFNKIINNVNMLSRIEIQNQYSIDYRLHIADGLYKKVRHIRMMNFASTLFLDPENGDNGHIEQMKDLTLSAALVKIMTETSADMDLVLTEPNEYNIRDLKTKIANTRAKTSEGAVYMSLKSLKDLITNDTIFKSTNMQTPKRFTFKTINTSIPFAIFGVEFLYGYEKYSHVKIDIYSASMNNEDERRSFVIWKSEDPGNYDFFIKNFDDVFKERSLCTEPQIETIEKWVNDYNATKCLNEK